MPWSLLSLFLSFNLLSALYSNVFIGRYMYFANNTFTLYFLLYVSIDSQEACPGKKRHAKYMHACTVGNYWLFASVQKYPQLSPFVWTSASCIWQGVTFVNMSSIIYMWLWCSVCAYKHQTRANVRICVKLAAFVIIRTVYPLFILYPFWVITEIIKCAIHLGLQLVWLVFYLYGQIK